MSLAAEIELEWADGTYLFALKAKQLEELEHICDEGYGRIVMRVFSGADYKWKHLRETIRLGLIGGGIAPVKATQLVNTYVDGCPIDPPDDPSSTYKTARAILQAVHFGWEALPDKPDSGEPQAATEKPTSEASEPHS